jgi:hypothetical protein
MKNMISSNTVLAALGAAVLFLASPASAQSSNMRIDVPFRFVAGDQAFPAGEYRIDVDNGQHICRIASTSSRSVGYVRVQPVTTQRAGSDTRHAVVRFAKLGDTYVMEGLWQRGAIAGNTLIMPRQHGESAKAAPVRDISAGSN